MSKGSDYPSWLSDQSKRLPPALAHAERVETLWVWTRLLSFILLVGAWVGWMHHAPVAIGLPILAVPLFYLLGHRHRRAYRLVHTLRLRREVIEESLRRIDGQVVAVRANARPDDLPEASLLPTLFAPGSRWMLTGQERDDLDLYAEPVGLFGLINRCSTALGALHLRDTLEHPSLDADRLGERQASVRALAQRHDAYLAALSALAWLRGADRSMGAFLHAITDAQALFSPPARWALRIWSLFSVALAILFIALSAAQLSWLVALVALLLLNEGIARLQRHDLRPLMRQWEGAESFAVAASGAIGASRQLPDTADWSPIRDALQSADAPDGLAKIVSPLGWISGGGMIRVLLNLVAFHDAHVMDTLLRRTLPRRDLLLAMTRALVETETLLSLAGIAIEDPRTVWPSFKPAGPPALEHAVHPLIDPSRAVPNTLSPADDTTLWVITGSNMSGKSTFLRTIGTNLLLAQIGGPAWARALRLSPVRLVTDLRARDNLSKGESYFLAEVRQLGRMLHVEPGPTVLGLIDEPLRGTNHQEQHAATVALVEHLATGDGFFILATHDQTIPSLVSSPAIAHHHFTEQLQDGRLCFDYQLRIGPSTSRNALAVLEQEGFPPDLVARARRIANQGQ